MKRTVAIYSPRQLEAIESFDSDLCVSAGAGSGKTSVLVERFIYAVTQRKMDPERVLAITFTDKAAGEMKGRLVEECRRRGLKDFRRRIEGAYIGTIHSFCSRILKENPIEAGVDPFFQVLSDAEAEILKSQLLERIFDEDVDHALLIDMLGQLGDELMRGAIKKFYEMGRAVGDERVLFRGDVLDSTRKRAVENLKREVDALNESLAESEATESIVKLKKGAQMLRSLLDSGSVRGWEFVDLIEQAQSHLHRRIAKHKAAVDVLHGWIDQLVAIEVETLAQPYKNEFERVCFKFKTLYEEEKHARAAYDFDDLLFIAYKLLTDPAPEKKAVRQRYQSHFTAILVDEYQDTSPLQDKIIEHLKQERNLFVVGDPQQSIYGFRYADLEIFQRRISGGNSANRTRHVRLDDNFRSREPILKFINEAFKRISADTSFHPLVWRRNFQEQNSPAVELLCLARGGEEMENLNQSRVVEAQCLAAHIQNLVRDKVPVHHKDGSQRPLEYRDIAILFRSTSYTYLHEKELADLSIPYRVTKGGGFYEKPEILDLMSCLKLIENPHADIALACVLRSPLVSVSDDGLFWLSRYAKSKDREVPLDKGLQRSAFIEELNVDDRDKLTRFNALIDQLRQSKNTLKIHEILEKICKVTSYEAKILTRPDGWQKAANIQKLVALAESAQENGVADLQDFIRYVQHLADSDAVEAEARVDTGSGNAVLIATIHAAKGLEFPCVIIADMGRKEQKGRKEIFLSSPEHGLGMKIKNPRTQKYKMDYTYSKIEDYLSVKDAEEEQRLLYVAMTRAQERLILSGSLALDAKTGTFKKSSSWMGRLAEVISLADSTEQMPVIDFEGVLIKKVPLRNDKDKKLKPVWTWAEDSVLGAALRQIRSLTQQELSTLPIDKSAKIIAFEERLAGTIKVYEESEDHSVTDLLKRSQSDSRIQDHFSVEKDKEPEPDDDVPPLPRNEYGTLMHRLMEFSVLHRKKRLGRNSFPSSALRELRAEERLSIVNSVLKFWAGPWGKRVHDAKACFPELPFIYKTDFGILKGQMDLVMQLRSGDWVILDYKTNRLTTSDKEAVAKSYEAQLYIYAFVFWKLYGIAPKQAVLYFSFIDETYEFDLTYDKLKAFEVTLNALFKKATSGA